MTNFSPDKGVQAFDHAVLSAAEREEDERKPGIQPWRKTRLIRELATGQKTQVRLASEYGVTKQAISEFKKRHARAIDEMKAALDDEFAAVWIADKTRRIEAYQADFEASAEGAYGSHYEHIKARTAILKAVAEELGQLPPRLTVAVIPVTHVLEGVEVEKLT